MATRRSTSSSKTLGYPSYLNCLPRFGTKRDFSRPTYGARQGKIARLLGTPYMPWQQYVADVLGEVDPKTGMRVYREGLITLMRQQGKTTYVISAKAHRALDTTEPQVILFAAQDGIEAKKKWLQHADLIKRSPLRERIAEGQPVTSNGKEVLTWTNGSTERPLSSRPSSGHGDTLDLGVVTEAFSQVDYRYEDTMHPAMLARPDAQYLAESTAGTATSIYWNERLEAERARMLEEPDRPYRVAFFDFSADETEDDIGAVETWKRRIPALGYTIRLEEIQHAWDTANTPAKIRAFKRGFLNITDLGAAEGSVFEDDDWTATGSDEVYLSGSRSIALDVTPDRSWASIAWAGLNQLGQQHAEVIAHDRGTDWVLEYIGEKCARNRITSVAVVANTQAWLMREAIESIGLKVLILSKADYAAGVASYYDGITDHTMTHLATGQAPLDAAIAGAAFGPGEARTWSPFKSTTIISPLVACTAAVRAHEIQQTSEYDALASVG